MFTKQQAAGLLLAVPLVMSALLGKTQAAGTQGEQADIVLVLDTSGSMAQADPDYHAREALTLAADLAPHGGRVALVAFDQGAQVLSPLSGMADQGERARLGQAVAQVRYSDNTNFHQGLLQAVELLEDAAGTGPKHVILLCDFVEGGFVYYLQEQYEEAAAELEALAVRAEAAGVAVDMLLLGEAPENSVTAPKVLELAEKTGGTALRLERPEDLAAGVEQLMFSRYTYQSQLFSISGTQAQTIDIPMPSDGVRRARIYVSAAAPAQGVSASYAGAALGGEFGRAYTIIDLDRPAREGIRLTVTPGESGSAMVHLLLDYDAEARVQVEQELYLPEGEKEERQRSLVQVEIVDAGTGQPLLTQPFGDSAALTVSVRGPAGELALEPIADDPAWMCFYPEEYGSYTVFAALSIGTIQVEVADVAFQVEDIRPLPKDRTLTIVAASIAGFLLVAGAVLVFVLRRHKQSIYRGATELDPDYRFHGKLYICPVLVDGGNREIPPFTFYLNRVGAEKRISLDEIFQSNKITQSFPGTDKIILLIGPEKSLVIRNNSKAKLRMAGTEYGYKQKVQLFFGQKLYVVFEENQNEIELYYRVVQEERQRFSSTNQYTVQPEPS